MMRIEYSFLIMPLETLETLETQVYIEGYSQIDMFIRAQRIGLVPKLRGKVLIPLHHHYHSFPL